MSGTSDSGSVVDRLLDLATGEVQEVAGHVEAIDVCLRGDAEGKTLGLIARMNALEKGCRQNHGNDQRLQIQADTNRMESPRRTEIVWTVDKIILAVATAISILVASFGAMTSTCNTRELRRDNRRWQRSAHVQPDTAEGDTAGP